MLSSLSLLLSTVRKMNLERAFFNPWKDHAHFIQEEKQKILRAVFIVSYLGEMKKKLKWIIWDRCYACNPDYAGNNLPDADQVHTCTEYGSLEKAIEHFGDRAIGLISLNNKTR